jgi:hypothetical protein
LFVSSALHAPYASDAETTEKAAIPLIAAARLALALRVADETLLAHVVREALDARAQHRRAIRLQRIDTVLLVGATDRLRAIAASKHQSERKETEYDGQLHEVVPNPTWTYTSSGVL